MVFVTERDSLWMSKKFRRVLRIGVVSSVVALLFFLLPFWVLAAPIVAWLVFGVIDVARNDMGGEAPVLKRYFFGNGILTWLLSPFNLVMDLLSKRTARVLKIEDLPEDMRGEVECMLDAVRREKDNIIARIQQTNSGNERLMLMYKWYDQTVDSSIPELSRPYRYIKTIGVSTFQPKVGTKYHYGPLRITYRLLYNLSPVESDDVYIDVGRTRNIWRDSPCFIFDDTLMHRSVNESDEMRYCMFVDLMRPSPVLGLTTDILHALGVLLKSLNRLFYKNWEFI